MCLRDSSRSAHSFPLSHLESSPLYGHMIVYLTSPLLRHTACFELFTAVSLQRASLYIECLPCLSVGWINTDRRITGTKKTCILNLLNSIILLLSKVAQIYLPNYSTEGPFSLYTHWSIFKNFDPFGNYFGFHTVFLFVCFFPPMQSQHWSSNTLFSLQTWNAAFILSLCWWYSIIHLHGWAPSSWNSHLPTANSSGMSDR